MNGWTPERRRRQSELIRSRRLWKRSTDTSGGASDVARLTERTPNFCR